MNLDHAPAEPGLFFRGISHSWVPRSKHSHLQQPTVHTVKRFCPVERLSSWAICEQERRVALGTHKDARHTIHEPTVGTPELEVLRTLGLRATRARIHVSSTSVPALARFSLRREMEDQTAL